jgi:hypothetical protein
MVRRNYIGLINPAQRVLALRPAREDLIDMSRAYSPTSVEYHAIGEAIEAIDKLALVLANQPDLFLSRLHKAG